MSLGLNLTKLLDTIQAMELRNHIYVYYIQFDTARQHEEEKKKTRCKQRIMHEQLLTTAPILNLSPRSFPWYMTYHYAIRLPELITVRAMNY